MSSHSNWAYYSYNHFVNHCNYLYLGSRQNRALWSDFYAHMYSHTRADYSIFHYRYMWLNYIKKINLISRLFGGDNHFFFITNRLEHLQFLDFYADKMGANTLFYERAGQFSLKCEREDGDYTMGEKMPGLGISNYMTPKGFATARSRVFIAVTNNSDKDRAYFKFLTKIEIPILIFSPADTNSHYAGHFLPLFGNNNSPQSWNFYLNIFTRNSSFRRVSSLRKTSTRCGSKPVLTGKIDWKNHIYKQNFGRGAAHSGKNFTDMMAFFKKKRPRAIVGEIVHKARLRAYNNPHYAYDNSSGIFQFKKNFHYAKF